MMKQVYLILAALMLLCLAPMPYGYYILVRFVSLVVFGLMAYLYYNRHKTIAAVVFGVLALLFQPIYKITLRRVTWNVIDVFVAILLVGLYILEKRLEKKAAIGYQQRPPQNQIKLEDNEIEFKLDSRLSPKELVYIASEEDKDLIELFEAHPEVIESWGKTIGFHVIYLPLLMKKLKQPDVLKYRLPYLRETEIGGAMIGNDFLLQYLENPNDRKRIKQGFIRTENIHRSGDRDKAINRFYPLSSQSGEPIADQLYRIGKQISYEQHEKQQLLQNKRFDDIDDWEPINSSAEKCFNSQLDGENIDDLLEEVKERIVKLRQRGIAEHILEQLFHPDDRLSRLVITKDYRILLPDYNNMEIKMEPMVKAVFLLFLNHPEGIVFKHLPDYREELAKIYTRLKTIGLSDRAMQSIEDVTNPLMNSINEKCARIRGAFVCHFDDHIAKHYYIDGRRGEAKKITLPRDLVTWE